MSVKGVESEERLSLLNEEKRNNYQHEALEKLKKDLIKAQEALTQAQGKHPEPLSWTQKFGLGLTYKQVAVYRAQEKVDAVQENINKLLKKKLF